ncbi:MAG: diguanylate cyclase [Planctomycetes bacterium]|nr:diguanylate cyclase [Planctomycetota bacterium]
MGERLRAAVAALPVRASVSIGVASFAMQLSEPRELVVEADHAMYRAKAQGRNRVIGGAGTSWNSGRSLRA